MIAPGGGTLRVVEPGFDAEGKLTPDGAQLVYSNT